MIISDFCPLSDVGPSVVVRVVEHTSFHFGLCGSKFVNVPAPYAIAGNTRELYHCLFIQMKRLSLKILGMHLLAAASRPRLSETELKWFMFETSCYAFGGRIRRFAKLNAQAGYPLRGNHQCV